MVWSCTPGRPGILACGSLLTVLYLPVRLRELTLASARQWPPAPAGVEDGAPRLQWRHRVGVSPTSRDHPERAEYISGPEYGSAARGYDRNTTSTMAARNTKNYQLFFVFHRFIVIFVMLPGP